MQYDIRLAGYVNLPQVEQTLASSFGGFELQRNGSWSPLPGFCDTLTLDLADLRSVDLASLVQLVIVARAATHQGSLIHAVLPHQRSAAHFLSSTRFFQALAEGPRGTRTVTLDRKLQAIGGYDRMFPLQWVSHENIVRTWIQKTLQHSVGDEAIRMPWQLAMQLSELIHHELLDNVVRHSGTGAALVAVVADSKPRFRHLNEALPTEREPFGRIGGKDVASIQIEIADEGMGVHHSLRRGRGVTRRDAPDSDPELLAWAFDRWSSSTDKSIDRGTRGLYRVSKLASIYQGFATLRSGQSAATQWSGSIADIKCVPSAWAEYSFPGTMLRVEIPISIPIPPIHLQDGIVEAIRVRRPAAALDGDWRPGIRNAVTAGGITVIDASGAGIERMNCVRYLEDCARMAHPYLAAVINLPANDTELQELAIDINTTYGRRLEEGQVSEYDELSPVLVVGSRLSSAYWVGCHPDLADAIHSGDALTDRLAQYLDASLRTYRPDGHLVARLTPSSLAASIHQNLVDLAKRNTRFASEGSYIVTPSLSYASSWVDAKALFCDGIFSELLARLLITRLESLLPLAVNQAPVLLYEEGIDDQFARIMISLFHRTTSVNPGSLQRVSPVDLESNRPLNLRPGSHALILVQATSEGHASRQLCAYAVRQGLVVDAILCPIDLTGRTDYIRLWGIAYPVIAAHSAMLGPMRPPGGRRPTFIDKSVSVDRGPRVTVLTDRDARDLVRSAKAVRAGHFLGDKQRHFTFIIDPDAVMNSDSVSSRLLDSSIETFGLDKRDPDDIMIVVSDDGWPGNPSGHFARLLSDRVGARYRPRPMQGMTARSARRSLKRSPALVVVWNCISGESLWSALQELSTLGAESIDVLVVFSQLSTDELRRIVGLRELAMLEGRATTVRVRVLARLPLGAYSPATCPMCSRDYSRYASASQDPHALQEIERLRGFLAVTPWPLRSALPSAATTVDTQGSTLLSMAIGRRGDLMEASRSTPAALDVANRWITALEDDAFVASVATLVLYEPFWLRRIPLRNSRFRRLLGDAMVRVATRGAQQQGLRSPFFIDALRFVSKSSFLDSAAELLKGNDNDEELTSSVLMHLEAMLELPYLSQTSFPLSVETAAQGALAVFEDPRRRDQVERIISAARTVRKHSGSRAIALRSILNEARLQVLSFHEHAVHDLLWPRLPCPATAADVAERISRWRRVRVWINDHLRQPLSSLRPWLSLTQTLDGFPDFEANVAQDGSFYLIEELHRRLEAASNVGSDSAYQEVFDLESKVYGMFDTLFGAKYRTVSTGERLLIDALDECSMNVATLVAGLESSSSGIVNFTSSCGSFANAEVPLPSGLALTLAGVLIGNASRYGGSSPNIYMTIEPFEDTNSWLLTFSSRGRVSPTTEQLGPGGLHEAQVKCRSIGSDFDWKRDGEHFVVTLAARGYVNEQH